MIDRDALGADLLKSFHAQFAENQREKERSFVQIAGYLGAIVFGYAYVYHRVPNDLTAFSLACLASVFLLGVGGWLVCIIAHNWRRDQLVNARIREFGGVMADNGVFPRGFDPRRSLLEKNVATWMPDLLGLFYVVFPVFQLVVAISYASRFAAMPSWADIHWGITATVVLVVVLIAATLIAPLLLWRKLSRWLAHQPGDVRDRTERAFPDLWRACHLAQSTIEMLVKQGAVDAGPLTEGQSIRVSLTAVLIQSHTVPATLLLSGHYWAASAILRQHMECLARIIEVRSGNIERGRRPPNVTVLPFRLGMNYGRLSEYAHLSGEEFLGDFALGSLGEEVAEVAPVFRESYAREFLCVHLAHLFTLMIEVHLLHVELYGDRRLIDVSAALNRIASTLVSVGFWQQESSR